MHKIYAFIIDHIKRYVTDLFLAATFSLFVALHVVGEGGGGGVASIADATLVRLPVVMCLQVDFQMIAPAKEVLKVVGRRKER